MRRFGILSLVVFQAVFLNIVVPGHTRGVITTTGKSSVRKASDLLCGGCCTKKQNAGDTKGPEQKPSPSDRKNCLICSIAATLNVATAFDSTLPKLAEIELLSDPVRELVEESRFVHTYDACAPPLA